ncbi:tripartite tricarboxylate transporter permease [Ahrensia kielensis]|uniref:Tripartite tricarboxylate transporter permease n=1 Tax=Ahrensia kielensis TaxID=76980 RepID=A0ABU9T1G0_9HYPH
MSGLFDTLFMAPAFFASAAFLFLLIGLLVGIVVGALPGVGPLLGVAMAVPFTFYMDPVTSMALLMGIYQGGSYGGAISATLIGIPGTPMAAATLLDAYPMALGGHASRAITLATLASSLGGIISAIVLIAIAPALAAIAIKFGPSETAAFTLLGLATIGAMSGKTPMKGWLMGFLGLVLATIGLDPVSGVSRFTFGSVYLDSGIVLIPLLVGLFSLSEVLIQLESPVRAFDGGQRVSISLSMFRSIILRPVNYIRSSLIGIFVGILPGVGGDTAAFLSYRSALPFQRPDDEKFGYGNPDGVIASEAANSAVTGGALIPMLALAIPGDPIVAVLMSGLVIQGIQPGAAMFLNNPDVVQGIFLVFLIGAALLLPLGLFVSRGVLRVLELPQWLVMSTVLMVSLLGTYVVARQIYDLYALLAFGVLGYLLRKANFPIAPIVIGFVLGPIFERNFRRTGLISQGDMVGYLAERPITIAVLLVTLAFVILPFVARLRNRP